MKQIPNLFTLLNLVFGCIAIVLVMQPNEIIAPYYANGEPTNQVLPERIQLGALFIFGAALIDFLDGFLARLFKATSRMGEQLDSLSDVVSFGVAPGMILYQLLRMGFARDGEGIDTSFMALLPAFVFTAAVAWRLAKFNISTNQTYNFRGVPSPAGGLLIASFPLIIWYEYFQLQDLFKNPWFLYAVIVVVSYLMVSNLSIISLKFRDYSWKSNQIKYLLALVSLVLIVWLKWLAVPVIFVLYVLLSLFSREPQAIAVQKEMPDATI